MRRKVKVKVRGKREVERGRGAMNDECKMQNAKCRMKSESGEDEKRIKSQETQRLVGAGRLARDLSNLRKSAKSADYCSEAWAW